jgi:hypothetical protein
MQESLSHKLWLSGQYLGIVLAIHQPPLESTLATAFIPGKASPTSISFAESMLRYENLVTSFDSLNPEESDAKAVTTIGRAF